MSQPPLLRRMCQTTVQMRAVAVGRQLPVRVNPADPSQMLVQWEKVPV